MQGYYGLLSMKHQTSLLVVNYSDRYGATRAALDSGQITTG